MIFDNENPELNIPFSDFNSLHQMFLTPGFAVLEKLLDEKLTEVTRAALSSVTSPEHDVQLLNNLRGCSHVINAIHEIRDMAFNAVTENNQQLLFPQRDNHHQPWIADGFHGKESFLGGV